MKLTAVRVFVNQIRQVPSGFKRVFVDTHRLYKLWKQKGFRKVNLSREEFEFKRETISSIAKLGVYFILQLPPIIGILPTIVALSFPRQLLTHHFWSESQREQFMMEEYFERRRFSKKLEEVSTVRELQAAANFELRNISTLKLRYLAGANGVCNSLFVLNYSPRMLLIRWIENYAHDILTDDELLEVEGTEKLSSIELQIACLRRGGDHYNNHNDLGKLRSYLESWIRNPSVKLCRTNQHLPYASSLLCHKIALPDIFLIHN